MNRTIKFRAFWRGQMAIQGEPDLESLASFMHHYADCELMQFTGLKDKNGKEIYEGDIVQFGNGNNAEVTFENGCFSVWGEPLGWDFTPDHDNDYKPTKFDLNFCEVIGNIYENAELIKK